MDLVKWHQKYEKMRNLKQRNEINYKSIWSTVITNSNQ